MTEHRIEPLQHVGTTRGDGHDVAAAVLQIGLAPSQPTGDEIVQRCDDVAAVDAGAPPQLRLAGRAVLVVRGEQANVIATEAFGGERVSWPTCSTPASTPLQRLAALFAEGGWAPTVAGGGLTHEFSAPSAGPPPWYVYEMTLETAYAVDTKEPGGATRWSF